MSQAGVQINDTPQVVATNQTLRDETQLRNYFNTILIIHENYEANISNHPWSKEINLLIVS